MGNASGLTALELTERSFRAPKSKSHSDLEARLAQANQSRKERLDLIRTYVAEMKEELHGAQKELSDFSLQITESRKKAERLENAVEEASNTLENQINALHEDYLELKELEDGELKCKKLAADLDRLLWEEQIDQQKIAIYEKVLDVFFDFEQLRDGIIAGVAFTAFGPRKFVAPSSKEFLKTLKKIRGYNPMPDTNSSVTGASSNWSEHPVLSSASDISFSNSTVKK